MHPGHARHPRRGALIIAKVIGITVAGLVLSVLTSGLGLATAVAELSAHHLHHLPAGTGTLFAGSVIAGTLFGVIGVALGYITHSTIAVVGAVGWVLFAELAILHTLAPHLARWLITGAASTLTDPGVLASRALSPATAVAVLGAYAVVLLAVASHLALRAMWPDPSSPTHRRRPERAPQLRYPSAGMQNVLICIRSSREPITHRVDQNGGSVRSHPGLVVTFRDNLAGMVSRL